MSTNARFTLADPMPRLGSDAVGGNSGRNHPTSRRHTIHIGRGACNASVGTRESYNIVRLPGWYGERVLFITTLSCVVHVRLPIGRRRRAIKHCLILPDDLPSASRWGPDGRFRVGRPFTLAEPTASGHNRGIGSANVKRASKRATWTAYHYFVLVVIQIWLVNRLVRIMFWIILEFWVFFCILQFFYILGHF